MNGLTVDNILRWTGGRLLAGSLETPAVGVSVDSRSLAPGDLFVALSGGERDGHSFVADAFWRGASGALVSRPVPGVEAAPPPGFLIRVGDGMEALVSLARNWRRNLAVKVAAVTGSNGKTTTKDLAGRFLAARYRVAVAPRSYNNLLGVSLSLLRIKPDDEIAVLELGMNRPGEIAALGELCRPEIGLILNVGPAHLGFFPGLDEIAQAKGELLGVLEGEALAVLNLDDPLVAGLAAGFSGRVAGFGLRPPASFRAEGAVFGPEGVEFEFVHPGGSCRLRSPLPGLHNLYNCLAALTAAVLLGVEEEKLAAALAGAVLPPLRMEKKEIGGIEVILDAYNANPASMRAALAGWLGLPVEGERIFVSGDMAELGEFSLSEHQRWGRELASSKIDRLVFVGELSAAAAAAAEDEGFALQRIHRAAGCREAAELIRKFARPGDSVLVKGSRVMALEKIADFFES